MITRIVKLEFEEGHLQDFLLFFDEIKHVVNNFEGCVGMRLYQDIQHPNVVMTYSHWRSEEDLERYRTSGEFGNIWPKIKPWFSKKPEAWTLRAHWDGFALS